MKLTLSLAQLFRSQAAVNAIQTIGKINFQFVDVQSGTDVVADVEEYYFRVAEVKNYGAAGGMRKIVVIEIGVDTNDCLLVTQFDVGGRCIAAVRHHGRATEGEVPANTQVWLDKQIRLVSDDVEVEFPDEMHELVDNLLGHREVRVE